MVIIKVEERWECDCGFLGTTEAVDIHIRNAVGDMTNFEVMNQHWGRTLIGSEAWNIFKGNVRV